MGFTGSQLRLERLSEIFSVSADRRGGVSPPSFAGELADCGAGFQPVRPGKDARTTKCKAVEVRMPSGQDAAAASSLPGLVLCAHLRAG
jgi:hypothetical protein